MTNALGESVAFTNGQIGFDIPVDVVFSKWFPSHPE
jgi:hypothetical protein